MDRRIDTCTEEHPGEFFFYLKLILATGCVFNQMRMLEQKPAPSPWDFAMECRNFGAGETWIEPEDCAALGLESFGLI